MGEEWDRGGMTTITQAAARRLDQELDAAQAEEGIAVRLESRFGDLWTMRLDRQAPGDRAFDYRGRTVLLMDPSVADATVDTGQMPIGVRLILLQPRPAALGSPPPAGG
jgi:hypothetical protein